jgi:hypothetical protein
MGDSLKTMGWQRCRLYQLNFLLPLMYLWARVNHHFGFARYIEDLYFQYPAVDDNSKIRALSRNRKNLDWNNAYQHQALLEFYYANLHSDESTITKRD